MIRTFLPLFGLAFAASVPAIGSEIVPVPYFDAVGLRGGGTVSIVPGPVQRVTIIEGSSRFTRIYVEHRNSLRIDACNRDCPQHYRLRIEVQSPRVPTLALDGGGAINVAGGFGPERELVAAVNGGGSIDTRAVNAGAVTAAVNGGGDLLVRASSRLTGAVRGGGAIRYWGDPQVTTAIDGGGTVQPGR
jgi:hypothetical protein